VSLTVHLVVPDTHSHASAVSAANNLLRDRFRVAHTTIQLEREDACQACVQRPAEVL
jgi:Co/Zn/Cd efflux system component